MNFGGPHSLLRENNSFNEIYHAAVSDYFASLVFTSLTLY
jgi:hypothetical protein